MGGLTSGRRVGRTLVFDAVLLVFWLVVFVVELLFVGDLIWLVVSLVLIFVFALLLGRDFRRLRSA